MKTYSRVYAQIDLDAILNNMEQMKCNLGTDAKMIAVIKADGYGHGAVPIARMLEEKEYIWGFAVATLDEAIVLRKEGIEKPLLVLGCIFPEQYKDALKNHIRMTVYTEEMAESISKLAKQEGECAYIHIKFDTGMTRLGFNMSTNTIEAICRIHEMSNVCLEGAFTHFSKADEENKEYTKQQIQKFSWVVQELEQQGIQFAYKHCANSAGIIDVPESHFDLVRAGISCYGLYPSEEVDKTSVKLRPAMQLKSHVVFVKEIPEGTSVSYGGTYVTKEAIKLATIPVGYADGYSRNLSNIGYVLIRGQKAPITGRICMDQFMVDVTHIDGVSFGDEVTLIGRDGNQIISVEELGDLSGRFNYEFVCGISKRVPRVYVQNGKIV